MFLGQLLNREVSLFDSQCVWIAVLNKTGTSHVVHVRQIECLTGREPTNTKRPILVNSFCMFLLLSSALVAKCFEVHSKHTEQQLC